MGGDSNYLAKQTEMKTQTQHFYSSHRKMIDRLETFNFITKTNPPTIEELEKLRAKNPKWNKFPKKLLAAN